MQKKMSETQEDNFLELVTGKLFAETEKEEENKLEELLQEEKNKILYNKVLEIHEKLPNTKPLHGFSAERSWTIVNNYFHQKKIRVLINISKYASIILLAFFIGTLINVNWKSKIDEPLFSEINVPLGQMSNITLYDGTQAWLNSGTSIKYANSFGDKNRKIILDGEAFFKVKHNEIPFIVQLKNCEIEVLGTSFNAKSYTDENFSEVTLVEGSVKMKTLSGKEIIQLKPSQQITVSEDLKNNELKTVDTGFYKSWTEGKIVFHEERLADIVFRLERWYNVDIQLATPKIGDLCFSGTILKNKPFNQIAKAFEILLPVKIEYQNKMGEKDVVIISKK
jgi:transmembrane sensor